MARRAGEIRAAGAKKQLAVCASAIVITSLLESRKDVSVRKR